MPTSLFPTHISLPPTQALFLAPTLPLPTSLFPTHIPLPPTPALFLNVLFKAMKADTKLHRVMAFGKRLLQECLYVLRSTYVCALILTAFIHTTLNLTTLNLTTLILTTLILTMPTLTELQGHSPTFPPTSIA